MKSIKCSVFLAVAVFAIIGTSAPMSADEMAQLQTLVGECMAAEGATEADMHRMMAMEVPDTAAGACLNACMMEKTGVTVGGVFSPESSMAAAKRVTDGNADKLKVIAAITSACGASLPAIAAADRCAYAKQVVECNTAGALEHGFAAQRDLLSP